jgi:hypothetical protein
MVSEVTVHHGGEGVAEQSSLYHVSQGERESMLAGFLLHLPFIPSGYWVLSTWDGAAHIQGR